MGVNNDFLKEHHSHLARFLLEAKMLELC